MTKTIDQVETRLRLNCVGKLLSEKSIEKPEDAVVLLRDNLRDCDKECFCVINIDTQNKPINFSIVSIGDIDCAAVFIKPILKVALLSNASKIVVAHNHPSGSLKPSKADRDSTDQIQKAAKLVGIELLDSIILSPIEKDGYSIYYDVKTKLPEPEVNQEVHEETYQAYFDMEM